MLKKRIRLLLVFRYVIALIIFLYAFSGFIPLTLSQMVTYLFTFSLVVILISLWISGLF